MVTSNYISGILHDKEIILKPYYNTTERKEEYTYLSQRQNLLEI
jgi:hypothetical protein